jgi:hypothetical protein
MLKVNTALFILLRRNINRADKQKRRAQGPAS